MVKAKARKRVAPAKLLEAAAEVFAEKGFHGSTTREIAAKANVNVASLHYHFRDKRRLYLAVFEQFVDRLWAEHPLPGVVSGSAPLERRLAAFIEAALRRMLEGGRPAWTWKLLLREMADPTEAMDVVVARLSGPLLGVLSGLVREALGARASEEAVRMHASSVVGQCLFYRFAQPMLARLMPQQRYDSAAIAALAAHVTRFSLAALRAAGARPAARRKSAAARKTTGKGGAR